MADTSYNRRKEDRPQELAQAAYEVFTEKGYAAARMDDVAKRAGVSKGLPYLYFKTKDDLFKAVVKSVVIPRLEELTSLTNGDESASEVIRGPLLEFMKRMPSTNIGTVIRLLVAEGQRHPDLLEFYYENVVSHALGTVKELLERGVKQGEFRETAVSEIPQLVIAPVFLSVVWQMLFEKRTLDTDRTIETHINMLLNYIEA